MEDTETTMSLDEMREFLTSYSGLDPMEDTETLYKWSRDAVAGAVTVGSIRWRILKRRSVQCHPGRSAGYSGLDPMEDTETTNPVRHMWRNSSYSGLDPMEDTETPDQHYDRRNQGALQWARSDGGY